jgi:hypothetical protein
MNSHAPRRCENRANRERAPRVWLLCRARLRLTCLCCTEIAVSII